MFCPLYTNKEVFDEFNEIVEAFGGRAMTEEEFRSSELRNQREGRDLQAVNAAYTIWDMNGGYALDKAKNGEPSLLFQALLEKNDGDRLAAIKEKSDFYKTEYFLLHGNWLAQESLKEDLVGKNGEVNWSLFEQLLDQYHNSKPDSMFSHGRYTLSTRPENHFSEEKNTLNHIKFVTQSMLNLFEGKYDMDLPFVSEARSSLRNQRDLMVLAAMFHDVAKPYRHGDIHGWESADILRDVLGIDYNNRLAEWAVRHHMPMPFSHKAEFSLSNPEAIEVAKNIARDARRIGIDANTAINAFVLINAADVINGRELNVDDNWAKKAGEDGLKKYNGDISVKNVLSIELNEKVALFKKAFEEIKDEDFGDTEYNYKNQERFNYKSFPEGGRLDNQLPFLKNVENITVDKNGEPVIQIQRNTDFTKINKELGVLHQLEQSDSSVLFSSSFLQGQPMSSGLLLKQLLQYKAVSIANEELAEVLSAHDIPVKIGELESNVAATTFTDNNGGSVIVLNRKTLDIASNGRITDAILHEVMHALTVPAIDNPKSESDRQFAEINNKIYSRFNKIARKMRLFEPILNNEKEFISYFTTDRDQRQFLYDIAKDADIKDRKTIKNILKSFINAISRRLIGEKVFLTNVESIDKYQQAIKNYLYNKPIIYKGNLTNKQLFDAVYNLYDPHQALADTYIVSKGFTKSLLDTLQRNNLDIKTNKSKQFDAIAQLLNTRLVNIRKRSAQDDVVIKQQQGIKYQIDLITRVSYLEKIIGFQTIAQNLEPQIQQDNKLLDDVQAGVKELTSEQYQTLAHQDVATYKKIASDINKILGDDEIIEEFVSAAWGALPNRPDLTTPEGQVEYNKFKFKYIDETIKPLVAVFKNIISTCATVEDQLHTLNVGITSNILADVFDAVKNPNADEYLQKLMEIETDSNVFWKISPIDYEQDDALRAIGYLVRKANRTADNDTYDTIMPILEGLEEIKDKISIEDFYEKNNGKTTGYLVREFNYGKFYDDYAAEMARINEVINKKYGLNLLPTNRTAPDEENARKEFNDLRNSWLEKNSIRRFVDEYYRAQADLPTEAVRQMRSLNRQLFQINSLPNITSKDSKYPDYYKLTPEQWEVLQEILTKKKMLRSDYDEWGNLKSPEELKIARAIQKYYETLRGKDKQGPAKDRKAWATARSNFLESLGATGFYNQSNDYFDEAGIKEWMKDHGSEKKQWDLWNERNSIHIFKQNQDNEALVFKQIENELASTKPNYGAKDEKLTKEINDLLNIYHGTNGHINDQFMSIEIQKKLIKLMEKQFRHRERLKKMNKSLKEQADQYSAVLNKYITFEKTERYKQLEEECMQKAMQFGSNDYMFYFLNLMKQYGSVVFLNSIPVDIRPFRWFTSIKAKDEEMWMEWAPGDSFTDFENSISYKNEEFKEEYGVSYIPKGKAYDNTKAYNKVKDTAMYKSIIDTMRKAYSNMENRSHSDPYLLPQITGSMYKYMQGHATGKVDGAISWLKDNIGLNGITQNDSDYGYDENSDVEDNQVDEAIDDKLKRIGTLKNMPDGHVMHFIPQFYTKRNRPELISKDLVGIISTFYNMSSRYKYKTAIKDDCETIVDMLEKRNYKKKQAGEREEIILGKDTKNYRKARTFLDMNLYGMRRIKETWQVTPQLQWEVTKTADLLKRLTTANNLGANPKVALVGFLTTYYGHIINAITGNGYDYHDAAAGAKIVTAYILRNIGEGAITIGQNTDIGRVLTDHTLINIMERFNLANQFERKTSHTNMNRAARIAYENSVFGLLSSADFLSKATILASVMHAFRLVDGEFVNVDAIYRNAAKIEDESARNKYITDKLTQYNSKDVVTMYDAVKQGTKKFEVKKEYETAFNNAYYVVQATAEKLAERADGMATEEQKGMITQSILGSLILIHRQYLPLQWVESFAAPVYDMDMQTYKGGRFHVMYKYIKELAMQSTKNFTTIGAILGTYLGLGTTGVIPAAAIGAGIGYLAGRLTKQFHKNKSFKQVNKEFFNNTSTEDSILRSRHYKRVRNQVLSEVALCKVLQIIVSMFCGFMDDPDKKDDKGLQFLALVLRQLEWETYSPYRGDDVLSQFKSVSASTGTFDDIQNGFSLAENALAYSFSHVSGVGTASSPLGTLFDTISVAPEIDIFREMRSGPYEGVPYWEKVLYKLTPWSNAYEQYRDSKGKRKYLENQVFKINK